MHYDYDTAVIGAGILGCFAARNLSRWQLSTILLEAREDICTGITRSNTAVIYPGYDVPPGTLKARLCMQRTGRSLFPLRIYHGRIRTEK